MKEKIKKIWGKIKAYLPLVLACLISATMILSCYLLSRCTEEKKLVSASAYTDSVSVQAVPDCMNLVDELMGALDGGFTDWNFDFSSGSVSFSVLPKGEVFVTLEEFSSRLDDFNLYQFGAQLNAYSVGCRAICTYFYNGNEFSVPLFNEFDTTPDTIYTTLLTTDDGSNRDYSGSYFTIVNTTNSPVTFVLYGISIMRSSSQYTFVTPYFLYEDSYYNTGYDDGYEDGQSYGFTLGEQNGYDIGFDDGHIDGYDDGYDDGFLVGKEELRDEIETEVLQDKETFLDGLLTIFDAPMRVIREAFNFELFGINISSLVFFILTCAIVVLVIKRIRG